LQRDVTEQLGAIPVESDEIEATTVLAVALDTNNRIVIPKDGGPLVVLFLFTSRSIVLGKSELNKLRGNYRHNLHFAGATL